MKDLIYCLIISALLILVFHRKIPREVITVKKTSDTVYMRDTIREEIPEPSVVYITRIDTVKVFIPVPEHPSDSTSHSVALPIEEKVYRTDNFRALVRGYRPELVSLDLFPESRTVYSTEIQRIRRKPRFGVGIQAGYGYTSGGLRPYAGIGIHYNLWSF